MRIVNKIESKIPQLPTRQRVAAYARASEEKGRAIHSLSAQVSFYSSFIQKHPEWEYAGVYSDGGISGTTEERPGFQQLITDCDAGKIDVVLTKSISRFARNTVDLLETVRHLRDLGIEVRFEKEHINSLTEDGELMLTLLASFAQEESRSISENVKWAIRKGFEKGQGNQFCIYGYRWDGKEYHIVPEEAEIVRLIYANFLAGLSAEQTEKQLEEMGVKSYTGGHLGNTSIRQILRQERYTGNTLFQKTYIENHISHKSKLNRGELPMFYAENTHPAIIDQATFDAVQAEVARRRELGVFANWSINTTCFTSKIKCGNCGASYRRSGKRQRKDTNIVYYVWTCQTKDRKGIAECHAKDIPEEILKSVSAETLHLSAFDEVVFSERVEKIVVQDGKTLIYHFVDGTVELVHWESSAKKDWWTPERRRLWGERHKRKDTNPNKGTYYEFTGFIKCGQCGANYRCQSNVLKDGTRTRSWYCTAPSGTCDKTAIKDKTMKTLVAEVLSMEQFDETVMDSQIEYASVLKDIVTFHFRDGHTADRSFEDKRRGAKHTDDYKKYMSEIMKQKWRDRRGENSNDDSGDNQPVYSSVDK